MNARKRAFKSGPPEPSFAPQLAQLFKHRLPVLVARQAGEHRILQIGTPADVRKLRNWKKAREREAKADLRSLLDQRLVHRHKIGTEKRIPVSGCDLRL